MNNHRAFDDPEVVKLRSQMRCLEAWVEKDIRLAHNRRPVIAGGVMDYVATVKRQAQRHE